MLQRVWANKLLGAGALQVAVDIQHHKTMFELHQKVSPSEVILGW